jgi:hypothetical protein
MREEREAILVQMKDVETRCQRQAKVIEDLTGQLEGRTHRSRRRSGAGMDGLMDPVRAFALLHFALLDFALLHPPHINHVGGGVGACCCSPMHQSHA